MASGNEGNAPGKRLHCLPAGKRTHVDLEATFSDPAFMAFVIRDVILSSVPEADRDSAAREYVTNLSTIFRDLTDEIPEWLVALGEHVADRASR